VANSEVLAAVSRTLVARITAGLSSLATPDNPAPFCFLDNLESIPPRDPARISLFLYDIIEEATVRNRAKSTERQPGGQLLVRKQPLGLCLHYMLIPWGGDRETELILLGRAMQVMYDDAILDGPELLGALAGTPIELRVSLATMQVDDRARIWWAINLPYHLSVNYEVRVVDIDATTQTSNAPVQVRELATGVPETSGSPL
jgi:Pvc16 N-terminal domain